MSVVDVASGFIFLLGFVNVVLLVFELIRQDYAKKFPSQFFLILEKSEKLYNSHFIPFGSSGMSYVICKTIVFKKERV